MPTLTGAQLELRRTYVGGTDLAALSGMNPPGWAQPIDVWMEKVGQAKPRPTTPKMAMGHLMEDTICELFAASTGYLLRRPMAVRHGEAYVLRDPQRPWLAANPDRYGTSTLDSHHRLGVWYPQGVIVEAKHSDKLDDWGPQGSLQVPPHYAIQCQHYLGVTGRPVCYLCVLLPRADFRWYALWRDDATIEMLRDLGTRFWHDNVLAGVPPAPDGSDSYSDYLRQRWASDDSEAVATSEQMLWVAEIQGLDARAKALAAQRELVAQQLMDSMGTTKRLLLPGDQRVTWGSYPKRTVHWDAVAADLLRRQRRYAKADDTTVRKALDALASDHTTTTMVRPLTVPAPKEAV